MKQDLGIVHRSIVQFKQDRKLIRSTPKFVPAGQSTQMVVGATHDTDKDVLYLADQYYKNFQLRRVYYSGYIPISQDDRMPAIGTAPPLIRENRLYQTDWLLRFYGFGVQEIVNDDHPNLDLEVDPKLSWALRNPALFPVDINRADYQIILRVPGVGVKSARKIVQARRFGKLHSDQLKRMGVAYNRAQHFIRCADSIQNLRDPTPEQIRKSILSVANSKYAATLSPQLQLVF